MTDRIESVDDLSYELPLDVLHYETRYFLGLTMNELLIVSVPAIGLMLLAGIPAGVLTALTGLLLAKRFEALGGRSLPVYLVARLRHIRRRDTVVMPLILPSGGGEVVFTTWEGEEIMRIGSEN